MLLKDSSHTAWSVAGAVCEVYGSEECGLVVEDSGEKNTVKGIQSMRLNLWRPRRPGATGQSTAPELLARRYRDQPLPLLLRFRIEHGSATFTVARCGMPSRTRSTKDGKLAELSDGSNHASVRTRKSFAIKLGQVDTAVWEQLKKVFEWATTRLRE